MTALSKKAINQFKTIWDSCEPFYGGKSTVPDYQMSIYYTQPEDEVHRYIYFPEADRADLAALYAACKPAYFGRNGETVRDDTYRKAKKMDLDWFSTLFDPHSLGIFEQVSRGLLTGKRGSGITGMKLYKLNVYGEGDFFKPHRDTPRSQSMVGSLVVVLPTQHEGGQLVLRQGTQEWTLDFADKFTTAANSFKVCFVAFFGNVEHEVLPVTSGYRVTLTYNLYCEPPHPNATYIPTPFHERLKKVLVDFINDKSILPKGGHLGCGLVHEYVYDDNKPINLLLHHLKGADQILATICEELDLEYSLTKLTSNNPMCREDKLDFLGEVLSSLTIDDVEGVEIIGRSLPDKDYWAFVESFYDTPITQILEIRPMSSVSAETTYISYGNEASLDYVYGKASMLITLDPAAIRKELVL